MKNVMILGGLLAAAGVLVAHFVAAHSYWEHEPLHSILESLGAFVALSLAAIMLFLRKHRDDWAHSVWFSSALTGMGILNGFHAAVSPGPSFAWLRSAAILTGGLLSALIWLPDRCAKSSRARALPVATALAAVISGILLTTFSDHLPTMVMDGVFTPIAIVMHILGGLSFLAATLRFVLRYRGGGGTDELLFAYLCLLFGMSGMVFQFSPKYWHPGWWLWHILQLAAYFLALSYGVVIFNRVQNELTATNESLRTEVAARKKAEHALQDKVCFLETLMNTIPSPIFYKDAGGLYMGCNKAFEAFLGLSKDRIIGKSVYDLAPRELADKYYEMDSALCRQRGIQIYEAVVPHADGNRHDVVFYKSTFLDSSDSVAGLVGVILDITGRKRAEEALRHSHDELEVRVGERTAEIVRANEKLVREISERKQVEEALRQSTEKLKLFAYSVVHDLKSPTVATYGLTKLLSRQYGELLDERGRKYCDQILKATEHVAEFIDKINVFIATKEAPLSIETIRISEIAQTIRDEFSARLGTRQLNCREIERDTEIRADRLCILRAMRNFVDNALKYGGEELREIRITCKEFDDCHILSVSDDGRGMKQENHRKVFEPFKRNASALGIEGAGLGLAIVKEIAQRHGGRVWVEPAKPKGVRFCISISKSL